MGNCVFLDGTLALDPEAIDGNRSSVTKIIVKVDRRESDEEIDADYVCCYAKEYWADLIKDSFNEGKEICLHGQLQKNNQKHEDGIETEYDITVKHIEPLGIDFDDVQEPIEEPFSFIREACIQTSKEGYEFYYNLAERGEEHVNVDPADYIDEIPWY